MSYNRITSTLAAEMTTIKAHWNSVISTLGSRCATIDIKDLFLNSKLKDYEHMKRHESLTLQEFITACNLQNILGNNDFFCMEMRDGMCGYPKAGRLTHNKLVQHLAPHGCALVKFTPGL